MAIPESHDALPDAATLLAWQAYCYIADELSPAERVEFEVRLEHEQAAREALGCLVQLTEAVRVLKAHPAPVVLVAEETAATAQPGGLNSTGQAWQVRWVSWLGWGVAAALGTVLLAQSWQARFNAVQNLAATPAVVSNSNVVAYVDLPPVLESTWLSEGVSEDESLTDDSTLEETATFEDNEPQVGIPAWMLSAVSTRKAGVNTGLDKTNAEVPE